VQSIAPLATAGVFVAIPKPITKPEVPKIAKPRLRLGLINADGSFAELRALEVLMALIMVPYS
jgi:hypothetical protein